LPMTSASWSHKVETCAIDARGRSAHDAELESALGSGSSYRRDFSATALNLHRVGSGLTVSPVLQELRDVTNGC
jgi:hypothetical protein